MDRGLLHPDIQNFINANIGADITALALSKNPFPDVGWKALVNQVASKTKARKKLPTWFHTENIIYPEKVSIEQTSSEITALYKSKLVSGNTLIDLTGGFGVDDYYFSKTVGSVLHCEINGELSQIAAHNFRMLNVKIGTACGDGGEILKNLNRNWDWIFIDPSRRHEAKGKVFLLKDCQPNVPENLLFYFGFSKNILIKTSPLLDLSAGLAELNNVKSIHVVGVKNEVKELLWTLEKDYTGEIKIETVDIGEIEKRFSFVLGREYDLAYMQPSAYLYEPNSAIMKSGGFNAIASAFSIGKLHRHSHLYTSDKKLEDFPGRVFKIDRVFGYSKNAMSQAGLKKANITVRNFPETVDTIRKKWKISPGGDQFCFFTTGPKNDKIVLICTKI